MSNLNKFRKSTVAILTALLLIAIAAPLASFATAAGAPTASLKTSSGPNGTVITVEGTGFGASETVAATQSPINVSIDGHAAGLNVITLTTSALTGYNPAVTIGSTSKLQTSATGVLSGKIILYNLTQGAHTVIISDASTSVVAGTFTITAPSVTVSPTTVAAGDSVTVSGSAFPTGLAMGVTYTNTIVAGSFAGSPITPASGSSTALPSELSSNKITKGAYTATVSLPAITAGAAFTLRDAWNNNATITLALGTPTVTLSPASGPVGTDVTAILTGFGPTANIQTVKVGNNASASLATFTPATVTETGSAVLTFTTPAGNANSQAGVVGAQTVTVTDSLGNVATATFTVTPKVTLSLGSGTLNSTTTYAPASTPAKLFVSATGFKANSVVTITAPADLPIQWTNSTSTWTVSPGTYSTTTGRISTDANGAISFITDQANSPSSAGSRSISISDGTNSVSTIITINTAGLNVLGATTTTGAKGSSVTIVYFGATPTVTIDGTALPAASQPTAGGATWPTATYYSFNIQASSGLHTIAASGFNSISYTVLSPAITVVNPSSASVGTTVTIVGTGFAAAPANAVTMQGGTVNSVSALSGNTLVAAFQVPNYIPGTYTLSLSDGINSASTTFAVSEPQIQISPTTSTLATATPVTLAITGSGFVANDAITVYFDSDTITATTPIGLTKINTNGGMLINSGFVIPVTATAGTHKVTVIGASGASAIAYFTITPQLNALSAVRPGAQVTITGNGFAANSVQTLTVNGTATTWLNTGVTPAQALATGTVVKTDSNGTLMTSITVGFVVPSTTAAGTLNIVVTDASGNSASTTLTVLDTPAITLGSSSIVAGNIPTGVSIAGTGFTPGSRTLTANLYQGSTLVTGVALVGSPVTVAADGTFTALLGGVTFSLPASVAAGDYTLRVTAAAPTETADASITVLGLPTLVAPTTAVSGSNVTISVTGISKITDATFSSVSLVASSTVVPGQFGSITMKADFTKTTWFIVPTSLFAGTYLLTITDSNTGLSIQQAITVTPAMTVTPTTGVKGATIAVTATGFASNSALTAKVNGATVTLSAATSSVTGGIAAATFTIPITATATNTLTITDAAGNSASATFTLTTPTIVLDKETANVGNTVQILGSAFTTGSIVIQVGGQIITTTPATVTASATGSFMAYVTIPAGLSGNVTITATDSANNVGTAYITVGGSSTSDSMPSQATMDTTKQMTNDAGTATTTFSAGSTANAGFVLQTTGSPRDVIVKVTWQSPSGQVIGMSSQTATMDTTARQITFGQTIPAGAMPGTWTAQLQVYAADGVTALAVATLTFTVA